MSPKSDCDDVTPGDGDGASDCLSRHQKKRMKKKRKRKRQDEKIADDLEQSTLSPKVKLQKLSATSDPNESYETTLTANSSTSPNRKKKKKKKRDRRTKRPAPGVKAETEVPATTLPQKPDCPSDEAAFPYPTDPDDHCESPIQAYAHIQPLLSLLQSQNVNRGQALRIYDPYYCNGAVIENLTLLGFPSVYNKKEDCYKTWASTTAYPDFDVVVTNPPYSGDHIEKLVQHLTDPKMAKRPWFLLMPDWVHKKDFFVIGMKRNQIQPFYLVPKKRYIYLPPKNYRAAKKSDVHKKSSPFHSMWYIWGGNQKQNDLLIQHFYNTRSCLFPQVDLGNYAAFMETATKVALADACDLARSKSALRDLRRKGKKN